MGGRVVAALGIVSTGSVGVWRRIQTTDNGFETARGTEILASRSPEEASPPLLSCGFIFAVSGLASLCVHISPFARGDETRRDGTNPGEERRRDETKPVEETRTLGVPSVEKCMCPKTRTRCARNKQTAVYNMSA